MSICSAPWYELNLSAPDDNVSACCYYAGRRDEWLDAPVDIGLYWNGPALREVRRVQGGDKSAANGCSSCFFFQQILPGQTYYNFLQPPGGLSAVQIANWNLAKAEYESKLEVVTCTPLRLYANFGYACNLSCTMCHQVPRRGELKRQILADSILSWDDALARCLEVSVIGGEPFALPEAVKFVRRFIPDQRYETVRLGIFTNGTVLQKHWRTLEQKQLLTLGVSIDSIGQGYEKIRIGGTWATVERNILKALELKARNHPDWNISTTANIQKAGMPYLPEFAAWHVKHNIPTFFYDFITAPGVEDTYHTDNVLQNPHLLDGIPRWRDFIDEASQIFRSANRNLEAAQLEQYRDRVISNASAKAEYIATMRRQRGRNDWVAQTPDQGSEKWADHLEVVAPAGKSPVPFGEYCGTPAFIRTRLGDYSATPYLAVSVPKEGGQFRVRLHWPKQGGMNPLIRKAYLRVETNEHPLESHVEILDYGFGTDLIATGALPSWTKKFRVVLTPLGEEITLLPRIIEIDFDPLTVRKSLMLEAKGTDGRRMANHWLVKAVTGAGTRIGRLRNRLNLR
jgi:sulfatase maturation enzyme AslB (radical SAM superfamily)